MSPKVSTDKIEPELLCRPNNGELFQTMVIYEGVIAYILTDKGLYRQDLRELECKPE